MHDYRRFVQSELDARGWKQADLVHRSGLSRQVVSKILRDDREYLGQMPDESTLRALATGFEVPVERVRTAAARALARYDDAGEPLTADLSSVSIDALLQEIKRRVTDVVPTDSSTPAGAPSEDRPTEKSKVRRLIPQDQGEDSDEPPGDLPAAARRGKGKTKGELLRDRDAQLGEETQIENEES